MKNLLIYIIIIGGLLFHLSSCQPNTSSDLKKALTFYVSFDGGTNADFALGDASIYTAEGSYVNSVRVLEGIEAGMNDPNHKVVPGRGQFGDAFEFGYNGGSQVVFYKSQGNIAYSPQSWTGSISFWLSVDPVNDLDGYTDPIQITDANYNDASIWVDFTNDDPPNFRLGVIGDRSVWTLDTLNSSARVEFEKRVANVGPASFSRSTWTHVLITYSALGTASGVANLYLDGEKKGTVSGFDDPFTWELEQSNIYLGLGFNGLMDDLAIFNKPLTDDQVREVYQLEGGIKSILE